MLVALTALSPERASADLNFETLRTQLGSDESAVRARAIETYRGLGADHAERLIERTGVALRERVTTGRTYETFRQLRRLAGARSADTEVDVYDAIPSLLERERRTPTLKVLERMFLARALEQVPSRAGGRALLSIFASDYDNWRFPARAAAKRAGETMIPTAYDALGHSSRGVRKWGKWALRALDANEPVDALARSDAGLVARIVEAIGERRIMQAMPAVVSMIGDARPAVAIAARKATKSYGQNAVWQLRRQHKIHLGNEPPSSLGWQELLTRIGRHVDDAHLAPYRESLQGLDDAVASGDGTRVAKLVDHVLLGAPSLEDVNRVAPAVDALHAATSAASDQGAAQVQLARLVGLGATSRGARVALASLKRSRAEADLAEGVVDRYGYAQAARLDPTLSSVEERLETFGEPSGSDEDSPSSPLNGALIALGGLLLLLLPVERLLRSRQPREDDWSAQELEQLATGSLAGQLYAEDDWDHDDELDSFLDAQEQDPSWEEVDFESGEFEVGKGPDDTLRGDSTLPGMLSPQQSASEDESVGHRARVRPEHPSLPGESFSTALSQVAFSESSSGQVASVSSDSTGF